MKKNEKLVISVIFRGIFKPYNSVKGKNMGKTMFSGINKSR